MFTGMINKDYSISVDTGTYQSVSEHALPKIGFTIGTGIYMLSSNLNLNIRKTAGYNNKILMRNIDLKIGSDGNINNAEVYHKKSPSLKVQLEAMLPLKCI